MHPSTKRETIILQNCGYKTQELHNSGFQNSVHQSSYFRNFGLQNSEQKFDPIARRLNLQS